MATYEKIDKGARGSGKTYEAFHKLTAAALAKPDGRYLFVGPSSHSSELMTQTLGDHAFPMHEMASINRTRAQIELTSGSTIRFVGESQVDTLRGHRFDGIVADATEVWAQPVTTLEMLTALLQPDGFLIETRFEVLTKRARR